MELPSFGKMIILISFVVSTIIFSVLSFFNPHPQSPKFLMIELFRQSSFVYAFVLIIGLGYMSKIDLPNPGIITPSLVSICVLLMTISMGYAQLSDCDTPKRGIVFVHSLKPVLLLIITYVCVLSLPIIRQGFYDLVSKGEHSELGVWTALAFWLAGSIWISVTSTYFSIQEHACNSDTEIKIGEIPASSPLPPVI